MVEQKVFFWPRILAIFLSLSGCAGTQVKDRNELRSALATGQLDLAKAGLLKQEIAKSPKSQFLFFVEQGTVHYLAKEYYQALLSFEKAKKVIEDLFATQVGSKILSFATNDTFDVYYGQSYEKSLVHFYLALIHFQLYQQGRYEAHTQYPTPAEVKQNPSLAPSFVEEKKLNEKERSSELSKARAEILSWDSTLKTMRTEKEGQSVFKDDLLAKIFGAFVHEAQGSRSDDQTALQLYKDAKKILFRNYNAYPSFNRSAVNFKSNFSKLHELDESIVKSQYVAHTRFTDVLTEYLDQKINNFHKKKSNLGEVTILIENGFIPDKVPDKYSFGLEGAMRQSKDSKVASAVVQFGAQALSIFAAYELGLMPPRGGFRTPGLEMGVQVSNIAVENAAISFELPKIMNYPINSMIKVTVKNSAGEVVSERIAPMINPMGDVAQEAIAEDSALKYTKVGTRVALKHVTAIAAAYLTYQALAKNQNQAFFAKSAALLEYVAASKVIEQSERADLRYWSTLPQSYWLVDFQLPVGKYEVYAHYLDANSDVEQRVVKVGDVDIKIKDKKLLSNRIF